MKIINRVVIPSFVLVFCIPIFAGQDAELTADQKKIIEQVQSSQKENASTRLYTLDTEMQRYYTQTQRMVGQMQSPVILAIFNGVGGKYVLRRGGKQVAVEPVPAVYQQMKSVSHTIVGIFEIVSPYLKNSESGNWRADLDAFNHSMKEALATLGNAGMPTEYEENCRTILEGGIAFTDKALKTGKFTAEDYSNYAESILPTIMKNVHFAGKLQVDHFEEVVKRWRKEMGEEEWSRLYTVVNSAWAMRRQNVHFQIMAQMMGRDAVNDRLIIAEALNDVTEDDLLMLLGRVINDRALSILVFGKTYRMDVELMGEAARAETLIQSCPLYPATNADWMPYDDKKMPNEK